MRQVIDDLLLGCKSVFLLGRNELASQLSAKTKAIAIIDDFTDETCWNGLPIVKLANIEKTDHVLVISCSLAVRPVSAIESIKQFNFDYITFLDLYNDARLALALPFFDDARRDYLGNQKQYDWLRSMLNDEQSKKVFDDLVNFRNTGSFEYMKNYSVDILGQYFSKVIQYSENEVFIDAGAYDGQTSSEFIKHCPNYKSVYLFEPSKQNIDKAKNNLADYRNMNFIEKGLSNKAEVLRFHSNNGSASSIADDGDIEIQVDSLDNLVQEKVTFIKMDIEGAESLAIEGAKNHILNDHPKMAIAVYHKADDLWKIPQQVLAIRDDYDLYLRHYTEGTDETVMYFIPKAKV